jgi:adenosine deaminase
MEAFGYRWEDMVTIAQDGVEATWLDESDKRDLRARIELAAAELARELDPST